LHIENDDVRAARAAKFSGALGDIADSAFKAILVQRLCKFLVVRCILADDEDARGTLHGNRFPVDRYGFVQLRIVCRIALRFHKA